MFFDARCFERLVRARLTFNRFLLCNSRPSNVQHEVYMGDTIQFVSCEWRMDVGGYSQASTEAGSVFKMVIDQRRVVVLASFKNRPGCSACI